MGMRIVAGSFAPILATRPRAFQADEIDLCIDPVLMSDLDDVYLINAIKAARSQWHGLVRCLLLFPRN